MRRALCQPALRGWAPADAHTVSRRAAARSPQPPPSCSLQGLHPAGAAQRRERRALSAARCATNSPPPCPPPPPPPLLPPPPLWDVPWGPRATLATLAAVALSFAAVGSLLAPAAASALRLRPALAALGASAAAADAAALLLGDAMQAAACLALLRVASRRCLSPHASPPARLPWFDARSLSWPELRRLALCCVAAFPLVSLAADAAAAAAPPAASAVEAGFASAALDPPALAAYAALVALVSPLWEESLFRGFLLPSLTAESHSGEGAAGGRHARAARAIAASALLFAASHGSAERLLPLALLGVLLGVLYVYVCPGKLLAPFLAHAAWNACTFADCLLP